VIEDGRRSRQCPCHLDPSQLDIIELADQIVIFNNSINLAQLPKGLPITLVFANSHRWHPQAHRGHRLHQYWARQSRTRFPPECPTFFDFDLAIQGSFQGSV